MQIVTCMLVLDPLHAYHLVILIALWAGSGGAADDRVVSVCIVLRVRDREGTRSVEPSAYRSRPAAECPSPDGGAPGVVRPRVGAGGGPAVPGRAAGARLGGGTRHCRAVRRVHG